MTGRSWLACMAATVALGACAEVEPDPRRERYEADKRHCESVSQDASARKSCMSYRGWRDGKFRSQVGAGSTLGGDSGLKSVSGDSGLKSVP